MKKIDSVKEFVEKIDSSKKVNPKDLSSDQDLSIAIMNLISIEEHLVFSGAKTGKNSFYDLIRDVREMRKNLMQKIIPSYEGEVWCISKHLLASSVDDVKWIEDKSEDIKKLSSKLDAVVREAPAVAEKTGALSKMKAFVRKAVDCCIE